MLFLVGQGLCASQVYKSVDAEGNVSYSSTPPADAVNSETIAIQPPPESGTRNEAMLRENQLEQTSKRLQNDLRSSSDKRDSRLRDTQRAVTKAQNDLEKAQEITNDDWQGLAQGGRHLKESYYARITNAENRLEQAKKDLARTRRDLR